MAEQKSKSKKLTIKTETTLQFLQVFNGVLELTYKELDILDKFIDLGETVDLCSATNKRIVAKELHIKDHNTLNNYVKRLKDKKAIRKTKNGYALNPILNPKNNTVIQILKINE